MFKGFERFIARKILSLIRTYDAGNVGRLTTSWRRSTTRNINDDLKIGHLALIGRSHDLYKNHPLFRSIIRSEVAKVLPKAILPVPNIASKTGRETAQTRIWNEQARRILKRYFEDKELFSLDGATNFASAQRMALRTILLEGEVFSVAHDRANGSGVPGIRWEYLTPRHVYSAPTQGNYVDTRRNGIEYDADNRPVAYHFRDALNYMRETEVPAERVVHTLHMLYPEQAIGEPIVAYLGELCNSLSRYLRSTVRGHEQSSKFLGAVTKVSDPGPLGDTISDTFVDPDNTTRDRDVMDLEEGRIVELLEGESLEFYNRPFPMAFEPFYKRVSNLLTAAEGLFPAGVNGDYEGVNFSSGRLGNMISDDAMTPIREMMRDDWTKPIYNKLIADLIQGGALPPVRGLDVREHFDCAWRMPESKYIDPEKEQKAELLGVSAGLVAPSDIVRKRHGRELDEHCALMSTDREIYMKYGLPDPYGAAGQEREEDANDNESGVDNE